MRSQRYRAGVPETALHQLEDDCVFQKMVVAYLQCSVLKNQSCTQPSMSQILVDPTNILQQVLTGRKAQL